MKSMINNLKSLTYPSVKKVAETTVYVVIGSVILAAIVAALSFSGSEISLKVIDLVNKLI